MIVVSSISIVARCSLSNNCLEMKLVLDRLAQLMGGSRSQTGAQAHRHDEPDSGFGLQGLWRGFRSSGRRCQWTWISVPSLPTPIEGLDKYCKLRCNESLRLETIVDTAVSWPTMTELSGTRHGYVLRSNRNAPIPSSLFHIRQLVLIKNSQSIVSHSPARSARLSQGVQQDRFRHSLINDGI